MLRVLALALQLAGKKLKRLSVLVLYCGEVAPIQGHDPVRAQALREGDDRGIGGAEREVPVLLHEVGNPRPVLSIRSLYVKPLETPQEGCFDFRAPSLAQQK
jgi:hypothetical protein